ncbi:MAG: N-acetylmuramoyl-L-alanine amidase [Microgenomates group bacterium Gr01-1014_7]|nr:MAG: N-acetylmuramoyl-L-alanine amidase [Microgenomates group bacterium Gr01-1014_7]
MADPRKFCEAKLERVDIGRLVLYYNSILPSKMARTNLSIPSLGNQFVDIRDTIPGDSFNWSWVRPLSQVNFLAIHHTAGPDSQTPDEIANFHINSNGWGGIGYHFLIAKNGTVFYVGDISTARANVANLNEQVLGICLVGNFTSGRVPSSEQMDCAHTLCDFFINNYPNLSNVNSWDAVKGHKELPGQSTTCPGDNWSSWRPEIVKGGISQPPSDRGAKISGLYITVLGRDPDMGGLQTYTNSSMSIDDIMRSMVSSEEHKNLVRTGKEVPSLQDQINNLQASLSSVNQQVFALQETVQEKDQEINNLRERLVPIPPAPPLPPQPPKDTSLTILGALINLYKFIF